MRGLHRRPELRRRARRGAARTPGSSRRSRTSSTSGVTAVELLPVFQFDRARRARRAGQLLGLPAGVVLRAARGVRQPARRARRAVDEFRDLVKALHRAGLEVILDVVYNHTAEVGADGPTFCFRGLANDDYYMLDDGRRATSTTAARGNTLNANGPIVRRLILDSLRYWVAGDARRRLPVRPRGRPVARRGRASRWPIRRRIWDIETDPVLAGHEAHRRGVGRRRPVPGRQLRRRPLGASGTGASATTSASFVKSDSRDRAGAVAQRFLGSPDIYGAQASRAPGEHQLRDLPRRLHAQRPRLVRREAQRGQRRGEPRRQRPEPAAGTAASRARPTTRRSSALRAPPGPQLPGLRPARRSACRCCSWATRSGGRRRATTTPTATTTRSAGSTGPASSGTPTSSRFTQRPHRGSAGGSPTVLDLPDDAGLLDMPPATPSLEWSGVRVGAAGPRATDSHSVALTLRGRPGRAPPHLQRLLGAARLRAAASRDLDGDGWRRIVDTSLDAPDDIASRTTRRAGAGRASYRAEPRSVVVPGAPGAATRRGTRTEDEVSGAERKRMEDAGHPEKGWSEASPWYRVGAVPRRSGPGARSARTTAPAATPGTRSRTTTPGRAPTAGTRTGWPASPTSSTGCPSSLALWNGKDPILKERMFGLTNQEGNHGEDVKEYWWYLDALPSSAWLRWRYHYPQAAFPYDDLVARTPGRSKLEPGVRAARHRRLRRRPLLDRRGPLREGDADRHPDADHRRATAGPEAATLHVLPTLWFRNEWAWDPDGGKPTPDAPAPTARDRARAHRELGDYALEVGPAPDGSAADAPVLRERDERSRGSTASPSTTPYPKDGINDHVVGGAATVNPDGTGTKAAAWYRLTVAGRARRPSSGSGSVAAGSRRGDAGAARAARAGVRGDDARSARPRPTSSTRTSPARRRAPTRSRCIMRQAFAGHALEQAVLRLRRRALARRRPGSAAAAARARRRGRNAAGGTSTRPTSCRCPTPGSTRGSRPGTSPSTPSPSPTSTRPSPSTSCWSCAGSGSSTPTARCPPTSGRSTTSTRRSTPRPRYVVWEIDGRRDTDVPRADLPQAAASTSRGG